MGYFRFDLRSGKVSEEADGCCVLDYFVMYGTGKSGKFATIGNQRYYSLLQAQHWNRLLRIIKNRELDESGLELILGGFLGNYFPDEAGKKIFVEAVRTGVIGEIK